MDARYSIFFKGCISCEGAFRLSNFTKLPVQPFYDVCRVHDSSDIVTKAEEGAD